MDSVVQNSASAAIAVIWMTTIGFIVYRYRGPFIARKLAKNADIRSQRLVGAALLGVLPAIIMVLKYELPLLEYGLGLPRFVSNKAWAGGVLIIAVPLIYRQAQKATYWKHYPELKLESWNRKTQVSNALSWSIYLLAYEFLFRGLLLMSLDAWLGTWPAVSIMAAMYVLAHVDKSQEETFGSLAMSIIFAFAALGTESIWLPWIMHSIIAIASDTFAVRANPKIRCVL